MKVIKSDGGNYIIKLVKVRWYHKFLTKKREGISISNITLQIKVDEKGKLFMSDYISIGSGVCYK